MGHCRALQQPAHGLGSHIETTGEGAEGGQDDPPPIADEAPPGKMACAQGQSEFWMQVPCNLPARGR